MRISRAAMFMGMAKLAAQRATCFRLNVGAVVTVDNRVVSIGYNGTPPGHDHCSGNTCPGKDGCTLTLHAEANALDYVPPTMGLLMKDVYVTDSPCLACAQRVASSRVRRLFFATPYRDTAPLEWLHLKGVEIYQVLPSGMVVEWKTRNLIDAETL